MPGISLFDHQLLAARAHSACTRLKSPLKKRYEVLGIMSQISSPRGIRYVMKICLDSFLLLLARRFYIREKENRARERERDRAVCRSLRRRSLAPVASSWADVNVGEP